MNFNLPPQVRSALYVLVFVGSPIITYLGDQHKVSAFWVGLWAVTVSAVAGLARINVSNK